MLVDLSIHRAHIFCHVLAQMNASLQMKGSIRTCVGNNHGIVRSCNNLYFIIVLHTRNMRTVLKKILLLIGNQKTWFD